MRVTNDGSVDAVVIYLQDKIEPGEVKKRTLANLNPDSTGEDLLLDFDGSGRLTGIEVPCRQPQVAHRIDQERRNHRLGL